MRAVFPAGSTRGFLRRTPGSPGEHRSALYAGNVSCELCYQEAGYPVKKAERDSPGHPGIGWREPHVQASATHDAAYAEFLAASVGGLMVEDMLPSQVLAVQMGPMGEALSLVIWTEQRHAQVVRPHRLAVSLSELRPVL